MEIAPHRMDLRDPGSATECAGVGFGASFSGKQNRQDEMVKWLPVEVMYCALELQGIRCDMRKHKAAEVPGGQLSKEPPRRVTRRTEINDRGEIGAPRLELADRRYSVRYKIKGREI